MIVRREVNTLTTSAALASGDLRPPRRRRRGTVVCIAAIVLAAVCHAPLLRVAAGLLIVDEPQPPAPAYVLVCSGDRRCDVAADLYRRRAAEGVLLVEEHPPRLVREGIVPSREALAQRLLADRRVPQDIVTIIPGLARNEWQAARLLAGWIQERPDAHIVVLCDRFDSRRQRHVLAAALRAEQKGMISMRALPDRRFDERNWWKSREGLKAFFKCAVSAAYDYWCAEPAWIPQEWSPDDYERALKSSIPRVTSAEE